MNELIQKYLIIKAYGDFIAFGIFTLFAIAGLIFILIMYIKNKKRK
jgi:hypothetical protein